MCLGSHHSKGVLSGNGRNRRKLSQGVEEAIGLLRVADKGLS